MKKSFTMAVDCIQDWSSKSASIINKLHTLQSIKAFWSKEHKIKVESELSFRYVLSLLRLHKLIVVKVQMPTKHDIKMTARSKFWHQIDI